MTIRENVLRVREALEKACMKAGRSPQEVLLVAVSKTFPAEDVREACDAGLRVFGENRVQEAVDKISTLQELPDIRWHMIGHLQRNKTKTAVQLFQIVESLDSVRLARDLNRHAGAAGIIMPVLLQVNIGDEITKGGVTVLEAHAVAEEIRRLEYLDLRGLMAIPPYTDDPEASRPFFSRLRELRNQLAASVGPLPELSMGMSHDFEQAILEGATMVRVGSSIFGERTP